MRTTLLIFFFFSVLKLDAQQLEFYKESLHFELNADVFKVKGNYYFRNTSHSLINQYIFYPLPKDTALFEVADSVSVFEGDSAIRTDLLKFRPEGLLFPVTIPQNGKVNYKIHYQQKLLKNRARYILTTTRKWGKPLEKAEIELSVPLDISIDSCSYQPDTIEVKSGSRLFRWKKTRFMPDRDFVIFFSRE